MNSSTERPSTAGITLVDPTRARPAQLDRPLRAGDLGAGYADPHLEQVIARGTQAAREQARAEGYAQGWAQGRRAAAEQATQEQTRRDADHEALRAAYGTRARVALDSLIAATRAARSSVAPAWLEIGDAVVDTAMALARAALARELITVDSPVLEAIRTALRTMADADPVVHLHPEDHAALVDLLAGTTAAGPDSEADTGLPQGLQLVADPSVPRGGALAGRGAAQLLVHLPTALAKAEAVLRR